MAEPALDAGSVARTAYDRLSCSRKREHVLAIESVQAETCVRRIEKAPAMLRYQDLVHAPCQLRLAKGSATLRAWGPSGLA